MRSAETAAQFPKPTIDALELALQDAFGKRELDGRSIMPVLLGNSNRHRDVVFIQHTTVGTVGAIGPFPIRAARNSRYKLIRNLTPDKTYTIDALHKSQLTTSWIEAAKNNPKLAARVAWLFNRSAEEVYDLQTDPYEANNLAADAEFVTIKSELKKQL